MRPYVFRVRAARPHREGKMSPTRRKTAKAKAKMSRQEKTLVRAGLIKSARLKDVHRKKLAKLTLAEAKTLARVKRKLGYKGTLHIQSIIF
jgi:DNA-binding MarR family transcriptional regulator